MAHTSVGGDYAARCLNPLTLALSRVERGLHGPCVRGKALRGSLLKPPHPNPLPAWRGDWMAHAFVGGNYAAHYTHGKCTIGRLPAAMPKRFGTVGADAEQVNDI